MYSIYTLGSDVFSHSCHVIALGLLINDSLLKEVKIPSGVETIIINPHFEDGLKHWSGRGCNICRHEFTAYGNVRPLNGSCFASATGRVHNWNGIQQEITGRVQQKVLYDISSAVRIFGSANDTEVCVTLWVQEYGRERYVGLAK